MRNSSSGFNIICRCIELVVQAFCALFYWLTHSRFEPTDPAWICICKYVSNTSVSNAEISEKYLRFDKKELANWSETSNAFLEKKDEPYEPNIWDIYYSKYSEAFATIMCCGWIYDTLVIAQICPTAVRIRIVKNMKPKEDLMSLTMSNARMLEIEYRCGDGPGIPIDIPKSHYIVGNDILSKTYLLRYLEHRLPNYARWEFDEFTYSVRIIDSDFNAFSINGTQYIQITESGYRIMENNEN